MAATTLYASAEDVQAYLNELGGPGILISEESVPSIDEVELWLDQVAAEIDTVLRALGYTVPVIGSNDILFLGRYVAMKVAAMTWEAGFMTDELPEKIKLWEEDYRRFLNRLIEGKYQLLDQAVRAKTGSVFSTAYIED